MPFNDIVSLTMKTTLSDVFYMHKLSMNLFKRTPNKSEILSSFRNIINNEVRKNNTYFWIFIVV